MRSTTGTSSASTTARATAAASPNGCGSIAGACGTSLRHLPETIAAARYFSANKEQLEKAKREFKLHPRQPVGLKPFLSQDLQVDNIVVDVAGKALAAGNVEIHSVPYPRDLPASAIQA